MNGLTEKVLDQCSQQPAVLHTVTAVIWAPLPSLKFFSDSVKLKFYVEFVCFFFPHSAKLVYFVHLLIRERVGNYHIRFVDLPPSALRELEEPTNAIFSATQDTELCNK